MSGRLRGKTILLVIGALLTSTVATNNVGGSDGSGGLRRKRTTDTDKKQQQHRRLTEADGGVDKELASRFFLPSKAQAELDKIDIRELLSQMNLERNLDTSMSHSMSIATDQAGKGGSPKTRSKAGKSSSGSMIQSFQEP